MNVSLIMGIIGLILIATIDLDMMIIFADDSSELKYCATGEGKDGISVTICSVDKEKCDKNAEASDIAVKCHKVH
ncbi:MAG: hypothetical protein E6K94_06950 [Thaumarchaeota archaeon]|nr:MAG: hypothetical protein E6L01_04650 [Nitrososphaerota archaeon]TLX90509.1 MAG: hypothetical protein E6K94_06950 [Nitrososphaerota archaeon]